MWLFFCPPSFPQHLTKPLLAVAFLASFGSSMLYGFNLAVVNSPAQVCVTSPPPENWNHFHTYPKKPKLSKNEWKRLTFAHSDSVWLLDVTLWRSDCISLSCEVMRLCVWNLEAAVCLAMSSMFSKYYPSCAGLLQCLIWRAPVTAPRTGSDWPWTSPSWSMWASVPRVMLVECSVVRREVQYMERGVGSCDALGAQNKGAP